MAGVLVIQGLITSNFTFCISTCRGDSQKGHASSARPGTLRWGGRTLVDSALSKCMVDLSFFILLPNLASWSALAPRPSMLLQRREVIVLVMTRAYTGQCDSWSIDGKRVRCYCYWPHRLLRCYWQHPAPQDVSAGW